MKKYVEVAHKVFELELQIKNLSGTYIDYEQLHFFLVGCYRLVNHICSYYDFLEGVAITYKSGQLPFFHNDLIALNDNNL